jgi:hypothetical protein
VFVSSTDILACSMLLAVVLSVGGSWVVYFVWVLILPPVTCDQLSVVVTVAEAIPWKRE